MIAPATEAQASISLAVGPCLAPGRELDWPHMARRGED